jgi:hypothetical protein
VPTKSPPAPKRKHRHVDPVKAALEKEIPDAIRQVGWRRPNKSGLVKIKGKLVSGYVRGDVPWREVIARRSRLDGQEYLSVAQVGEGKPKWAQPQHEEVPL